MVSGRPLNLNQNFTFLFIYCYLFIGKKRSCIITHLGKHINPQMSHRSNIHQNPTSQFYGPNDELEN